jgi:hypothetical protein
LLRAATDTEIEITSGALRVTKQRDMDGGQQYGFELTDVYIGDDTEGRPVQSAVVNWTGRPKAAAAKASRAAHAYVAALETVLRAEGAMAHPFGDDGPEVFAVDRDSVRAEFYANWPADGETEKKRAAARRQRFNAGEKEAILSGLVVSRECEGRQLAWLARA